MYTGSIGQNRRPFASVPLVDHYFPAAAIEGARTTLTRCIQRGEGAGLVVGPSGTGKTMLCLLLAQQFRKTFQVAMLASGRLSSRRALFQAILYELGRPYRDMDEGELRLALIDYLDCGDGNPNGPLKKGATAGLSSSAGRNTRENTAGQASSGTRTLENRLVQRAANGMVLLVDEAHTLPLRLLEEIRLLSNLARNGQPLVRLVLVGAPVLEERFASPKLDSFSQRLGARCYLESFNRTETREYVQSQIDSTSTSGEEVFPEDTCQSVFQATGGVPRLINQVCDHALLLAHVAGLKTIGPANIEEAWADLQQLPAPCNAEHETEDADGGVIEFGSLDDSIESESRSKAPVFRVASVEQEGAEEEDGSEPDGQIHRIERLLAKADEDFQPAGSIGPEVELNFEEPVHPFQEEFEQEEVVSDRYAAVRAKQPLTFGTSAYAVEFEPPTASSEAPSVCIAEEPETRHEECVAAGRHEEHAAAYSSTPDDETRRHEYRQLFSRLRRG